MTKIIFRSRLWIAAALAFMIIIPSGEVFAREGSDDHHHGRETVSVGHRRYYYDSGRFYRWSLFGYVTIAPPIGAVVSALPFGYRTIVVGGTPYFCYNDVYYATCNSGYVVVPRPAVVYYNAVPQPSLNRETVVINVPNRDGSFIPITLLKAENGYVGPQGEYYTGHPTVEQLRALYGR
jgi:hypothetical protein